VERVLKQAYYETLTRTTKIQLERSGMSGRILARSKKRD